MGAEKKSVDVPNLTTEESLIVRREELETNWSKDLDFLKHLTFDIEHLERDTSSRRVIGPPSVEKWVSKAIL